MARPLTGSPRLDAPAKEALRKAALELGFVACGFAAPEIPLRNQARYRAFIANQEQGSMTWMAERLEQRLNPRALWPEVQSVMVLALSYRPDGNPLDALGSPQPLISAYAQGRDYHDSLKRRLKALARFMQQAHGAVPLKVFVDTAPVPEKALAQQAGLGWQGKHSNLVSRTEGSWLFLGLIYTALQIEPDAAQADHCGSCQRCITICPTNAITEPYQLDARRCLAYLSVEHEGPIPKAFRRAMGNRVYGCDDCLAVCPWNKFARSAREAAFDPYPALANPDLADWLTRDEAWFRKTFARNPIKRIGWKRFLRNLLIVAGNSGQSALRPLVQKHQSDADPVVAEAADWALAALSPTRVAPERA